jgi:hypothetical protein
MGQKKQPFPVVFYSPDNFSLSFTILKYLLFGKCHLPGSLLFYRQGDRGEARPEMPEMKGSAGGFLLSFQSLSMELKYFKKLAFSSAL